MSKHKKGREKVELKEVNDRAPATELAQAEQLVQEQEQPAPVQDPPVEQPAQEPVQEEPKAEIADQAKAEIPQAAMEIINNLEARIAAIQETKASRRSVASGSKPRPNVTYVLLKAPPKWHGTPQVAQLQQILFNPAFMEAHKQQDGSIKVNEPELFAAVEAGKAAGILRTKQNPVRIFQYYKSHLLNADCIRWE